jgi:hypothetical protein
MKSKSAMIAGFNSRTVSVPATKVAYQAKMVPARAPDSLYLPLKELVFQTFVGSAPAGRSLPNVLSDVYSGVINLDAIALNEARLGQVTMALKMAWTDPPRKTIGWKTEGKKTFRVYGPATTTCLDEALQAVYGYNPYIA